MKQAKMKAYRITELGKAPHLQTIDIPQPKYGEVLIRMAGAGICHTDLEVIDHGSPVLPWEGPFTLGHENAGYIEKRGEGVTDFEIGESVIVSTIHSCGYCEYCLSGNDNYCENVSSRGLREDGGMAEYMIADQRELVSLGELKPSDYVAIADAGLTPYASVKYAREKIPGDGYAVVIGTGGLGFFAIQFLKSLTSATVIALDINEDRLEEMKTYGADVVFKSDEHAKDKIKELTDGKGVHAVFDFVGIDATLKLAAEITKGLGIISLVGLGGGSLPFQWGSVKPGVELRISQGGTLSHLREIINLAKRGQVKMQTQKYDFENLSEALDDLRNGNVKGRAVLTFK
ncbi:NAD(P)-dependent alcohol dehydrogenase [Shouchella sp. JSM 1781072]|uniref:NAD(P)-dependent alcohol dehydrogenase n=1 Tax=Shouchella sp. JSM 1781072 TaxID=3344581 RepID=UPI0035C1D4FB